MTFDIPSAIWMFTLASILIELTPGPNMTYLAIVAATRGARLGFATVAGVCAGLAVIGALAAAGVSVLIQSSPIVYEALRWSGFLFLLYLAWDGWREEADENQAIDERLGAAFWRGFLTNVLNPKAMAFYVTVLPTFIDPDKAPESQTIILTIVYVVVATLIHSGIVVLAGNASTLLTDKKKALAFKRVLSVALALVAVWFFVKTAA